MSTTNPELLNKAQKYVILAITFGNILEWYEVYLYIFWAPTFASLFFSENSQSSLFVTIAFFAIAFIFRPLGGVFFGRLGDRIGRKKSFVLSIILMAVPTFLMGLIPVYAQVGIYAPIILAISRILQTFPSGGELPGAFCYLFENAGTHNRKFMSSFLAVGNQIGIALSAIESYLLTKYLPEETLIYWGWRISFIVGGLIGLLGFYLRYKLHETKLFLEMVVHHRMARLSIVSIISTYWKEMFHGIGYVIAETVSFHFVSIIFPIYFFKLIGLNFSQSLLVTICFLILTTLPLPIFGWWAEKWNPKKLLIGSCMGMLILLLPLYWSIRTNSTEYILAVLILYVFCLTCLTALFPYFISYLFPTAVRYTCLGLSFNIADGAFGGVSALIIWYLLEVEKGPEGFIWIALLANLISLCAFWKAKTKINHENLTSG